MLKPNAVGCSLHPLGRQPSLKLSLFKQLVLHRLLPGPLRVEIFYLLWPWDYSNSCNYSIFNLLDTTCLCLIHQDNFEGSWPINPEWGGWWGLAGREKKGGNKGKEKNAKDFEKLYLNHSQMYFPSLLQSARLDPAKQPGLTLGVRQDLCFCHGDILHYT